MNATRVARESEGEQEAGGGVANKGERERKEDRKVC